MTNIYQKFSRDIGLVALTNLAVSLSGLITLPIVSKTLGAYGYGIWAQLAIILSLVRPLTTLGLPLALVRYLAAEKDRQRIRGRFFAIMVFVLAIGLVICLILILLANDIGNALFDGNEELIRLIAIAVPLQGMLSVFVNYFRAFRKMKTWSVFSIVEVYGQVGLIAYFILSGYGLVGMAYALLATKVFLCVLAGTMVIPKLGIGMPVFTDLKEQLRFGVPTVPQTLSSWVVNASDRWVISFFLGAIFVGYYVPAYAMAEVIRMFFTPLALLLPPALSKLYDEGNISEAKTHLRYSLKYYLMLAIPSAFGLSLLSGELLRILSTPEIAEKGAFITPVVSTGIVLYGVYSVFLQIIFMIKKTKIIAITWGIAAVVNLGLNIALVPIFGIIGAAATTLFAFALVLAITAFYASREFTFPIDVWFIVKSLAASVVMGAIIWLVCPQGIFHIILMILAGAAIYFCALFLLRGFSKSEIDFFKNLILLR